MAEAPDQVQNIVVNFTMADPEGTAPIRVVAGHCKRVGDAWASLGDEMFGLAASMDVLVAGATEDPA